MNDMSVRSKGSLCRFAVRNESTYGTFSTTNTSRYGGALSALDTTVTQSWEEDPGECTYAFSQAYNTGNDYGFKATFTHPRSSAWYNWVTMSMGGLTGIGTLRDITPFTSRVRIASDELMAFLGCKVNSLKISSTKVGGAVTFEADILSQFCNISSTDSFTDASGTSFTFAEVDRPDYAPITDNTPLYYSVDNGVNWLNCDAKTWDLTITRNLMADADTINDKPLNAGRSLTPQECTVELSFTQLSKSNVWDLLKLADTSGLQFIKVIDGATVLLTGGYITGDMPSRSQAAYDETTKIKMKDMAVTVP